MAGLPRTLYLSLARARACEPPASLLAWAAGSDPLRLDLPPLGSTTLDRRLLEALAALYFCAELEAAGIVPVAEALAEARHSLAFAGERLAGKLEAFARSQHQWYGRAQREQLHASTFGLGPAATTMAGRSGNHDFPSRIAGLCEAIVRLADDSRLGPPGTGTRVRLRLASERLIENLAPRAQGAAVLAVGPSNAQLTAAVELLSDPELAALAGARGFWAVLRRLLGADAPDLGPIHERARAGLNLLRWLAARRATAPPGDDPQPGPGPAAWAAAWLEASGVPVHALELAEA